MGRSVALALLVSVMVWFAVAPVNGQEAPTTTAPPAPSVPAELDPIHPDLLVESVSEGERAAHRIRSTIQDLATARLAVVESGNTDAGDRLQQARQQLLARVAALQQEGSELDQIQFSHREVVTAYDDARRTLANHVTILYTANPQLRIANDFLRSGDVELAVSRTALIRAILDSDRRNLLETYVAAAASNPDLIERAQDVRAASDALGSFVDAEAVATAVADSALQDLEAVQALADDWVFPVAGDHSFVDTFLAPRMSGTRHAHRHQGIDVFADEGTPLVAVERGIVGRVGEVSLGGLRVWLIGESGANYYYAHLSGFAPDLEPGQFVEAGTVLGYVGNTGNAVTTPPHVHFQVHPDGRSAVNPYPLLRQMSGPQ